MHHVCVMFGQDNIYWVLYVLDEINDICLAILFRSPHNLSIKSWINRRTDATPKPLSTLPPLRRRSTPRPALCPLRTTANPRTKFSSTGKQAKPLSKSECQPSSTGRSYPTSISWWAKGLNNCELLRTNLSSQSEVLSSMLCSTEPWLTPTAMRSLCLM